MPIVPIKMKNNATKCRSAVLLGICLALMSIGVAGEWPVNIEAYRGSSPIIDGVIAEGEYSDANRLVFAKAWSSQPGERPSIQGWIKHDGENLYLAFDIMENSLPRAPQKEREKRRENPAVGPGGSLFPSPGSGVALFFNPTNVWSQREAETSKGNDHSWRMFYQAIDPNEGNFGRLAGDERIHLGNRSWEKRVMEKYSKWITNGDQAAVGRAKANRTGYVVEWRIRFDPCLKLEATDEINRYSDAVENKYWSPKLGRMTMGLNIGIQAKNPDGSDQSPAQSVWWSGEGAGVNWLKQWGSLTLNPGFKPTEIHVAANGNDRNPGSKERPFKTIVQAQNSVRKLNQNMQGDILVYVGGGEYPVVNPLQFSTADSGSNGFKVIYRAVAGEQPRITGGTALGGWKRSLHPILPDLWEAEVPRGQAGRQLYVNGKKAIRARGLEIKSSGWELTDRPNLEFFERMETVKINPKKDETIPVYRGYRGTGVFREMASWTNPGDIVFIYEVGWTHCILPVNSIRPTTDGSASVIEMKSPGFRDAQIKPGVQIKDPNYVENAFELLDAPGEWYHNKKTDKLYYRPRENEDMASATASLSVGEELLTVKGELGARVRDIIFDGLTFEHTTFLRPDRIGHAEIQANFIKDPENDTPHLSYLKTPAAVTIRHAQGITFTKCLFRAMGAGALDLEEGSQDNRVTGCVFSEIAASAIQVGGALIQDAHPSDPRSMVKGNIIANNYIDNIGTEFKGSIGIFLGYTDGTQVVHNEISNVGYTGISVGWGWGYWDQWTGDDVPRFFHERNPGNYPRFNKPTTSRNNLIAYNHVHHVLQQLHDGGGIYTLSMMPGTKIIFNRVHDNGAGTGWPGGIYLDEASGGIELYGNIVYNVLKPYHVHWTMPAHQSSINEHDNFFDLELVNSAIGVQPPFRKVPLTAR